jgi:hypothetical protein
MRPGSRAEREEILMLRSRRFMPPVFFVLLASILGMPATALSIASNKPATVTQEPQPVAWRDRPGLLDGPGSVSRRRSSLQQRQPIRQTMFKNGALEGADLQFDSVEFALRSSSCFQISRVECVGM